MIKEKRESLHFTHRQMYERTGISKKIIFNIEHGYTNASAEIRNRLTGFLFKNMEEFNLAEAKLNFNPSQKKATNYPHYSEIFKTKKG